MTAVSTDEFVAIEVPDGGFVDARFRARISGVTALLMNNSKGMAKPADTTIKRTNQPTNPTPEVEAEEKSYRLATGELFIPPIAIRQAMVEAGKEYKNPDNLRATMMKPIAAALGTPASEGFVLLDGNEDPLTEYAIDTRRAVVVGRGIPRSRARIDTPWQAWIEFSFDAGLLHASKLALALTTAGSKIGILDYRPQKSGPYGRFKVEEFGVSE